LLKKFKMLEKEYKMLRDKFKEGELYEYNGFNKDIHYVFIIKTDENLIMISKSIFMNKELDDGFDDPKLRFVGHNFSLLNESQNYFKVEDQELINKAKKLMVTLKL